MHCATCRSWEIQCRISFFCCIFLFLIIFWFPPRKYIAEQTNHFECVWPPQQIVIVCSYCTIILFIIVADLNVHQTTLHLCRNIGQTWLPNSGYIWLWYCVDIETFILHIVGLLAAEYLYFISVLILFFMYWWLLIIASLSSWTFFEDYYFFQRVPFGIFGILRAYSNVWCCSSQWKSEVCRAELVTEWHPLEKTEEVYFIDGGKNSKSIITNMVRFKNIIRSE